MKKNITLITCIISFFIFIFLIPEKTSANSTSQIDQYISINPPMKTSDNTIIINYTVKKDIPNTHNLSLNTYWHVYSSSKTRKSVNLQKKKGRYTVKLKTSVELVGPQYVEIKASIAGGHLNQIKKIATFYKYRPSTTTFHTVSKAEAIGTHLTITGAAFTFKAAAKRSPYGLALNLTSYGIASTYTLKSLNVINKGWPAPAAGQYIRTKYSQNKNGNVISIAIWTNKESYNKGVKPLYSYNETHPW